MKLSKLLISFLVLFVTFGAFSQVKPTEYPMVQVIGTDTVITFTFSQGKKLAILNEERKRLEELNKIISIQSDKKDTIIKQQGDQIRLLFKIRDDYDKIVFEKNAIQETCDDEKKNTSGRSGKKESSQVVCHYWWCSRNRNNDLFLHN